MRCLFLADRIQAKKHSCSNNSEQFNYLFQSWTDAFNKKQLSQTCALFSKNVTALYQGIPSKDYSSICNGFKKIFNQKKMKYQYDFKIHRIYCEARLAVVRITWYLKIFDQKKLVNVVQDEGMDVLTKDKGHWQIINYIAFPVSKKKG